MTRGVVVVGAAGRLGAHACELLERSGEFHVAARVGRRDDLSDAARAHADALALEVTVAGSGARNARVLLEAGLPTVVGTSGVTEEEFTELAELARARSTGVLVLPNFSRGAALLARLAREAARWFEHVDLVETHRLGKRDAPSGTARRLARELEETTGRAVPVHSRRLPGADATHELVFGAPGEFLRLEHRALGLEAYDAGILAALGAVARLEGGAHGWAQLEDRAR